MTGSVKSIPEDPGQERGGSAISARVRVDLGSKRSDNLFCGEDLSEKEGNELGEGRKMKKGEQN